ncbi:MAG: hypothetical protein JXR83_01355 [Deltaproteobacteria bacterium]|nr:hypothetical protein [Deltaproteobacteria bacterium]
MITATNLDSGSLGLIALALCSALAITACTPPYEPEGADVDAGLGQDAAAGPDHFHGCEDPEPRWPEGVAADDLYCRDNALYRAVVDDTGDCPQEAEQLEEVCDVACEDRGQGAAACAGCPHLNDECPDGAELGTFCFEGAVYGCALACHPTCGCDEQRVLVEECSLGCVDNGDGTAACASSGDNMLLSATVSACGGFEWEVEQSAEESEAYCAAEVLRWTHDPEAQTLSLLDLRALLNCCGEQYVEVLKVGETILVQVTDTDGGQGRCSCLCVYDFSIVLQGVSGSTIALSFTREVTDVEATGQSSDMEVSWQGELDLSAGAGEVVINEVSAAPFCGDE